MVSQQFDLSAAYSATSEFDEASLPAALQATHSTKSGTHAVLVISSGQITYVDERDGSERLMKAGDHQLILPDAPHHVELAGTVALKIHFFHQMPDPV